MIFFSRLFLITTLIGVASIFGCESSFVMVKEDSLDKYDRGEFNDSSHSDSAELLIAAENLNVKKILHLLSRRNNLLSLDVTDGIGNTALHLAGLSLINCTDERVKRKAVIITRMLLRHGARVTLNKWGFSPLDTSFGLLKNVF